MYARSRGGRYGDQSGHGRSKGEVGSTNGTRITTIKGGGGSHLRSGNHGHLANGSTHIKVEQSFEMRSLPIGSPSGSGMEMDGVYEEGKVSRDGSEKNLVVSHWEEEHFDGSKGSKKVTISSAGREKV